MRHKFIFTLFSLIGIAATGVVAQSFAGDGGTNPDKSSIKLVLSGDYLEISLFNDLAHVSIPKRVAKHLANTSEKVSSKTTHPYCENFTDWEDDARTKYSVCYFGDIVDLNQFGDLATISRSGVDIKTALSSEK